MTEYFLCLTPQKPIRIGTLKPKGNYLDTKEYLPGAVLRGSLVEWLKIQGKLDSFLPLVHKVRFGNLFPSESEHSWGLPFPITALECKLHGGFQRVTRYDRPGHGIRDTLLISLAYTELRRHGFDFPVPILLRCTHEEGGEKCGGRMERVGGFYSRLPDGWKIIKVQKAIQTKVSLSRHRRTSQEGMLYRVVGLRPAGNFIGRLWAEEEQVLEMLKLAVEHIGVGSHATRGFGIARLKEVEPDIAPLRERLLQFNETLKEIRQDLAGLALGCGASSFEELQDQSVTYFSVDLLSAAILRDRWGIPTLKLTLSMEDQWLEPVYWAVQPDFVGGFSTAWGLPKPTTLAASMGSVYVFRVEKSPEEVLPWLESLEAKGIGLRTDEGLGEILICHPFHKEVMPV